MTAQSVLPFAFFLFPFALSSADLAVGPVTAAPGRSASGFLPVAEGAGIPITVIHGAKPGPVLALVAGTHGYEYSPILALQRLRTRIRPEELAGAVVLVHVANLPSFLRRTIYYGPDDGKNLNRVFPGKPDGTLSERIAHVLTRDVIERTDYLVDVHCGDGNESLRPYSYWMRTGNRDIDQRSRGMAVEFGLDHIVIDDERPRDPAQSLYCSNTAATRGKPAITVESGGLGVVPLGLHQADEHIERLEAGVFRLLRHLKMLAGRLEPLAREPVWIVRHAVLRSDATGIFYPEVRKDQAVSQGALLGTVTDFFGKTLLELRAPFSGKMLYVIATPPVSQGEPLAMIGVAGSPSAEPVASRLPPPVELTALQDHRRLMDLLHIASLRPGANGRDRQASNAANYDESKANPYPVLPDPLVLKNRKKVKTAQTWWKQRRPEIIEDFDREIYGRVPKTTPRVNWEVTSTTRESNGDVPVITKRLVGHVDNSSYPHITVDIQLTLTTPASATGPAPVLMQFGFGGFGGARPPGRGPANPPDAGGGPSWQQQVLANGWGYAILNTNSIQADNGAGLTKGIIGLVNKGQPRQLDDWGALRAWAWGASRALDYFETDKSVDAKQVGVEGHSRYGKATIVAMAYDQRFAIAFVSSSGAGGVKLHRRNWGELVENVAGTSEYHWMAGNFLKYAGPLTSNDLPVDSHQLVAVCAPRPVFISSGATNGDGWVDAKGMFLAAAGAGPVYRLLGRKDMGTTEFPPIETPLIDGDVAFRQHSAGHTPGPNWPTFLEFAGRHIKSQPPGAAAAGER